MEEKMKFYGLVLAMALLITWRNSYETGKSMYYNFASETNAYFKIQIKSNLP